MQATSCAGSATRPYFITHSNGDHTLQHQYPTQPDNTCYSSRQGRPYPCVSRWTLTLLSPHFVTRLVTSNGPLTRKIPFVTGPPPYIGVCHEYEISSGIGDKPCHKMARNGTNRRS